MNISIDISPISSSSGHKVRGVGSYINLIKNNIEKFDGNNTYHFISDPSNIPSTIDLLHYPYFDPFQITIPFFSKHKTLITIHDLTPIVFNTYFPAGLKGNIRWNVQRRLLKRVSGIITDSESSKKDIVRVCGLNPERVHVVYLATSASYKPVNDEKKIKKILSKYGVPEKFFLYVGDVTWNKNLPRILNAILKTEHTLVLVGKSIQSREFDPNHPWNKDLVESQKILENSRQFLTVGFIPEDDLACLYSASLGLLMPSLYEGFGLPVLEAMSCGCPVITSKAGSLPEVGGDAVVYVDEKSIDDIVRGIKKLASDKVYREELCKKGIERSRAFSIGKMMKETIQIYESA